ncbi:MAG: hypothetical protein IJ236_01135 [Oscillospiraceae bacterium]|nr:hypothetical protein [Oscillospiraceae bacterium]MBQ9694933.1 hypothetical protein [Oscillospiraceae bacterium]MBR1458030.1 hypothetical protein [Oscillospiraceae bacterium]
MKKPKKPASWEERRIPTVIYGPPSAFRKAPKPVRMPDTEPTGSPEKENDKHEKK